MVGCSLFSATRARAFWIKDLELQTLQYHRDGGCAFLKSGLTHHKYRQVKPGSTQSLNCWSQCGSRQEVALNPASLYTLGSRVQRVAQVQPPLSPPLLVSASDLLGDEIDDRSVQTQCDMVDD